MDFTVTPEHIDIMPSAQAEWTRYKGDDSEADALERIMQPHLEHAREQAANLPGDADGGILITDIDGYDLSVLDANLNGRRDVYIFSRGAAMELWRRIQLLTRMGSETIH